MFGIIEQQSSGKIVSMTTMPISIATRRDISISERTLSNRHASSYCAIQSSQNACLTEIELLPAVGLSLRRQSFNRHSLHS
ncbi:hypothetical protein MRB53_042088 [Persea americana]|nr:hypothetical protein MRB53_042088 [Persea americana]